MSSVTLLPHNEVAYNKLQATLKDNQIATINHATGTGKSFIILKYLYENRDKRILYMAPTYPILDQTFNEHTQELGIDRKEFKYLDTMIYTSTLSKDMSKLASKYDIIILDEYHRCGAKKSGKQIAKLKEEIVKKYPDTKIVGLTATEIRYLDHNRNMKDLLFDGVEASRLTLPDAILQGILPAPVYINYNYQLLDRIRRLENRVKRYMPYHEQFGSILKEIRTLKVEIEKIVQNNDIVQENLKVPGKYIVFCPTINAIDDCEEVMTELFNNKPLNNMVVNSRFSRNKNLDVIRKFRNKEKNDVSVLYSINMLSEGLHVKDVDAEFMMRKTKSPIIYFQHIGRLLSYSKRKEKVVVFDLVNNVENHDAIYKLYEETCARAKELIEIDPENKERYEKVLENFSIVDITSKACEKIDKLEKEYTVSNIIRIRLESAISILEGKVKSNIVVKSQALIDIFKFQKYINISMFDRLSNLDLEKKPKILELSKEAFIEKLGSNENLMQKKKNEELDLINSVIDYINENMEYPSLFTDDPQERKMAKILLDNFHKLTVEQLEEIEEYYSDNLSVYEKIIYGDSRLDYNVNELVNNIYNIMYHGLPIDKKVYNYIRCRLRYTDKEYYEILKENRYGASRSRYRAVDKEYHLLTREYLEIVYKYILDFMVDKKSKNKDEEIEYISETLKMTGKYFLINDELKKEIDKKTLDVVLEEVYESIIDFIDKNHREPKCKEYKKTVDEIYETKLFYKKVILFDELEEKGYIEKIEDHYLENQILEKDAKQLSVVIDMCDFMRENNGDLPCIRSDIKGESKLAKDYDGIKDDLSDDYKLFLLEEREKYKDRKYAVLQEYVEFVKKHKREPLKSREDEKELYYAYLRCSSILTPKEKQQIRVACGVSKQTLVNNAYRQMLLEREMKR